MISTGPILKSRMKFTVMKLMKTILKKYMVFFLVAVVTCFLLVSSPASGEEHSAMQDCAVSTACVHCAVSSYSTSEVPSVLIDSDGFRVFESSIYIPPALQLLTPPPKA